MQKYKYIAFGGEDRLSPDGHVDDGDELYRASEVNAEFAKRDARIKELDAECSLWMTRCAGAVSLLPPETTCGTLQRALAAQPQPPPQDEDAMQLLRAVLRDHDRGGYPLSYALMERVRAATKLTANGVTTSDVEPDGENKTPEVKP